MMESGRLDKDMISQPELWRLVLLVGADRLDVALYPPVAREEMIWRSFPYDQAAESPLKALEDIVYDNPLLLCDFRRVDCLLDNNATLLMPAGMEPSAIAAMMRAVDADAPAGEAIDESMLDSYPAGADNAEAVTERDDDLTAFLRRTFYNIRFDSRLGMLCRYFLGESTGTKQHRVYVPVRRNRLTVIAFDGDSLLMANDFRFTSDIDAAYYIMASLSNLGIDPAEADINVGTVGASSEELTSILRRYIPSLRPLPFPTLRYRASKSTLQAPYELIIRPLCE